MSEKIKLILSFVGVFFLLQLIPVDRSSGDSMNEIKGPENVKKILQRSCYDCHSNKTNWPAYSYVFPVSMVISHHVKEGRHELNFSEWESYSPKKKVKKASEAVEEVNENEMPIFGYTWTHPQARLSDEDKQILSDWEDILRKKYNLLPGTDEDEEH